MTVYVIGNVAVDDFYDLAELPLAGESVHAKRSLRDVGGKGANQAVILARCGVDVRFVSVIGDDENGRFITAELAAEALALDGLRVANLATDASIILVDRQGENIVVTTDEAIRSLSQADIERALADAGPADLLLLQGNMSVTLTEASLRLARRRGLRTVFNPSPVRTGFEGLWPLVDLAVVNGPEALALTGLEGEEAAAALRANGVGAAVVTAGAKGALLATDRGIENVPAVKVEVVDTVGAGDTFLAVLTSRLALGRPVSAAAIGTAAAAAALTISRRGVRQAFPSVTELAALLP